MKQRKTISVKQFRELISHRKFDGRTIQYMRRAMVDGEPVSVVSAEFGVKPVTINKAIYSLGKPPVYCGHCGKRVAS